MRRPRKARSSSASGTFPTGEVPEVSHEADAEQLHPLGSWSMAELKALPRFPDRHSFPVSKVMINRYLEGTLTHWDLQVVLFWLGFALLAEPTPEEPTLSVVPLCKDLDTYVDTALELGYNPTASVHLPPSSWTSSEGVLSDLAELTSRMTRSSQSSGSSHSSRFDPGHSTSAGSSSSSPVEHAASHAAPLVQDAWREGKGHHAWQMEAQDEEFMNGCDRKRTAARSARPSRTQSAGGARTLAAQTGKAELSTIARGQSARGGGRSSLDGSLAGSCHGSASSGADGPTTSGSPSLSADTSRGRRVAWYHEMMEDQMDPLEIELIQAEGDDDMTQKVKLLYAGGWSSSSGSEGNGTPPTPPASSSGGPSHDSANQAAGGLDSSHVEQFTVSFISMEEDFQTIPSICPFCLDDMKSGDELCRLPCMHTFHRRCVHAWLERDRRCMLCRLDITRCSS
mmetsp:Transcript_19441/g.45194  ORF Transcript_19441/g.45194 Transcript_19441/m.45194 type:complete len:454 (+) Transcript_19441:82-1443(+)